jgi:hypothetical protein
MASPSTSCTNMLLMSVFAAADAGDWDPAGAGGGDERGAGDGGSAGDCASFGLAQFIQAFLYGVEAADPVVFVLVPVVLSVTALVAVWIPAMRATRINPMEALRYE